MNKDKKTLVSSEGQEQANDKEKTRLPYEAPQLMKKRAVYRITSSFSGGGGGSASAVMAP